MSPVQPVPPPTQFANEIAIQQQSKSISNSTNVKFSAQNSSKVTKTGGIRVLPCPVNKPVKLQEPSDHVDHIRDSNEADHFIEQLMKEAETDPKLRELTYGSSGVGSKPPAGNENGRGPFLPRTEAQDGSETEQVVHNRSQSGSSRPGRSTHRVQEESKMAAASAIAAAVTKRSQSADGRLRDNNKSSIANNATETLLNDQVVSSETANANCKSVRDLVNMMESNIKSESLNPYVRKWGCDLISPEPHRKNVTYRREKKQMVEPLQLRNTMERNKTFTWQQDDHFKRRHQIIERENDMSANTETNMILNHQASHHSPSGRDDHDHYLDNHTADLDDLLGRRPSLPSIVMTDAGAAEENERTLVVWPPPSPLPPPDAEIIRYPSPIFSPSPPPPMQAVPLPPRTPSPSPAVEPVNCTPLAAPEPAVIDVPMPPLSPMELPKKSNLKKRSQSEGTRRFSNSSLHEIDQQIVMIQNEFEAELDTLIDTYRNIQLTSRKTKGLFQ